MFNPPLDRDIYGCIDDHRAEVVSWHALQHGRYGFRIDGGFLHSYSSKDAAEDAYRRVFGRYT